MTTNKPDGPKKRHTKNQWQKGQSGNPSGKKKAAEKPPQPISETMMALLNETTFLTIACKKKEVTLAEVLLRKLLHNLINADLKAQVEALKRLIEMGAIDIQNIWSALNECDFDPFTEEHRRLIKITQEEMFGCEIGE